MDMRLPTWPSLAWGFALVFASGVALAWAMQRDTLPRAALRWVAPPAVAIGCIALWRAWPRGWAVAACVLALPLLVAAQVLLAASVRRVFRDGTDGDDDQAALALVDGYRGLGNDTAMPAQDPVGHFLFNLALWVLGSIVFCGAVLARLLWRLAPRRTGAAARVATALACSILLLAGSAMLASAGARPPVVEADAAYPVSADVEPAWSEAHVRLVAQAPQVSWLHLRAPLLPLAWPPVRDTAWTRYHYAGGGERGLLDAVWVAEPFAREIVARDGRSLRTERLPGVHMEHQGVRPLAGARDGPTSADADRAALAIEGPPTPAASGTRTLREVHRDYWSANSVLRKHVEPAHRAFFAWLDHAPRD